jgi:hypothetical protein
MSASSHQLTRKQTGGCRPNPLISWHASNVRSWRKAEIVRLLPNRVGMGAGARQNKIIAVDFVE